MLKMTDHTKVKLDDLRNFFAEHAAACAADEDLSPAVETITVVSTLVEGEHTPKSSAYIFVRTKLNELHDLAELDRGRSGKKVFYQLADPDAASNGDMKTILKQNAGAEVLKPKAKATKPKPQATSTGSISSSCAPATPIRIKMKAGKTPEGIKIRDAWFRCPVDGALVRGKRLTIAFDGDMLETKLPGHTVVKRPAKIPSPGEYQYTGKDAMWKFVKAPVAEAKKDAAKPTKKDSAKSNGKASAEQVPNIDKMAKTELRKELTKRFKVTLPAAANKGQLKHRLNKERETLATA